MDNGAKLLEHGYIDNDVVLAIKSILYKTHEEGGVKLVWLCDYHKPDDKVCFTHDDITIHKSSSIKFRFGKFNFHNSDKIKKGKYLLNHDKKMYIDYEKIIDKVNLLVSKISDLDDDILNELKHYFVDPLVFITNSEKEIAGGGDFDRDIKWRNLWANDRISLADETLGYEEFIFHL